jgi:hypothetical protein
MPLFTESVGIPTRAARTGLRQIVSPRSKSNRRAEMSESMNLGYPSALRQRCQGNDSVLY